MEIRSVSGIENDIEKLKQLLLCNDDDDVEFNNPHHHLHHLLNHFSLQNHDDVDVDVDVDASYIHKLNEELHNIQAQSNHLANQIHNLTLTHLNESNLLEANLQQIHSSFHYITSKDHNPDLPTQGGVQSPSILSHHSSNLEELQLETKVDEMKSIVKSLQDLHHQVKWFDTVDGIEDALTGLKVLAFDDNCMRLSMQTYIPNLDKMTVQGINDGAVVHHELLIQVFEGTMNFNNVQVFPNDIYVNDILDVAKSASESSLQWFIREVQDRIIQSTLRHLVVKDANKSRYSLAYLDKDETIVAHMPGGIDAYIKLSNGWPIFASPLKLISIKGSDTLKGTSLSFHCKVEKMANSLDTPIRQNILRFVDAVEKVLKEQLQLDLPASDSSA
ncbi:PREDICTED: uncharacterized protein LOC109344103 isoform X2 [Lupinus angustifolius]|uniref:uncharacterized protein LOC109344103 isoform X2 n=1 Tax=Lupinus angustifolius TaxID=3871 RepID=UPI00092F7180|nr:PREDICTED: uncharacterized protein LOC109344103 isoform X2 [Lupinus angustifolius]